MKIFSATLKGTTTVSQGTTNLSGSFTGSYSGSVAGIAGDISDYSSSVALRTTALEAASGSFSTRTTSLEAASGSFSTRTTSLEAASGSFSTRTTAIERVYATTGSNTFTAAQIIQGTLTAQTLVVQTVTSSVLFSTGSNKIGSSLSNVQELTGSVGITGSFAVNTNGTEFQVTAGGVNIGNALTDNHIISGSVTINPNGLFVSSSGNVGIGTTSPSSLSQFQKFLHIDGGASSNVALCLSGQNNAGQGTIGYDTNTLYIDALGATTGTNNNITFNTTSVNSSNGRLERMRITSAGNVGIGTTSPRTSASGANRTLDVKGGIYFGDTNAESCTINNDDSMIFNIDANNSSTTNFFRWATNTTLETGGSELMRLTEAGALLINITTSNSYPLEIEAFTGGNQIYLRRDGANAKIFMGGSTGASTALYIQSYNTNGVYLTAGGTSWTANSDIRLKNIISPIGSAVDKLSTLNPVIFSWKSDDTNKENIGLIAQEVKEVLPQVIDTNEDGFLGVRYVELVPVLVKAIQELSTENSTLISRIEALENK